MIQANEFRIGNWVRDTRLNKLIKWDIECFGRAWEGAEYFESDGEIDDIEGIPLTPEILEKANNDGIPHLILNNRDGDVQCWDDIRVEVQSDKIYLTFEGQRAVEILYVHQLQNLYFALTGEELPIEL